MAVPRYPRACRPPPWARGGHAQTLWAHVWPTGARPLSRHARAERREVELGDGDRLVVRALPGTSGVRAHLFHGLSGDADSDYVRRAAAALSARGHSVWAANHRGCGEGRGLAARPYHSGSSADVAAVLAASRDDAPGLAHVAIGFSLSGNALLLMAAERRAPWLRGLVAVNPPVDLARAARDVHRGLSRLYELRFLLRLRRAVRERERAGLVRPRGPTPLASLRAFDDHYTAPEGGFADADDYYARCSAAPRLAAIETPGVIVTAADDSFVDPAAYEGVELPEHLLLHVEPSGGHVGYLERAGLLARPWLDGALVHYVEALAELGPGDVAAPRPAQAPREHA